MELSALSLRKYTYLGRLVARKFPDLVKELISNIDFPPPQETDLQRITLYFEQFCQYKQIDPRLFQGDLLGRKKVEYQRVFIAVMIRLYCPEIRHIKTEDIYMRKGFSETLSKVTGNHLPNVSNMIRKVIIMEKVYDEFSQEVEEVLSVINQNPTTHGQSDK